jgi:hypothetical protein
MARVRLEFRSITIFEEEDPGATHVALYATVKDSASNVIASFRWNNRSEEVSAVRTYGLDCDPDNINVVYFDLNTFATLSVGAFADSDEEWPSESESENALGGASIVFDPRDPATLGVLSLGPTDTDDDDTGYLVEAFVRVAPPTTAADVRLKLEDIVVYDDEDPGATHMALYVSAKGPGIDREIFRWNNGDGEVEAPDGYGLGNSPNPTTQTFLLTGPTAFFVQAYADSDEDWPRPNDNENYLGGAMVVVDPGDPATAGRCRIGPTATDDQNTGFAITASLEILPATVDPDLSIDRIEVTQAIQFSNSPNGADNSVPLVAEKLTLVRAYIDSGVDAAVNDGRVPNVTGTLIASNGASFTLAPVAPFEAKVLSRVNPDVLTDTLNFLIPANLAVGSMRITVQATVGANVSNPVGADITFTPVEVLDILMVRVRPMPGTEVDRATYFASVNQLPLIYPIPTDPARSIRYWVLPSAHVLAGSWNLNSDDGMSDLLDDLEDIQEESADHKKLYGMIPASTMMARTGKARRGDNVALGYPFLMTAVGHELGHVYGLQHAPCGAPGNMPENTDDDFRPANATIGDVGVDVAAMATRPANTTDFMSYCTATGVLPYEGGWVSAYHWSKLLRTFRDM